MKLPKLTSNQQDILTLLYRYRFLERKQIQAFLGHTNKSNSIRLLKELREQQFIDWFYEPNTQNKESKPAIYYLGLNGIRWLREYEDCPEGELRKRYKDVTRKPDFVARCLLLADCGLHLEARNKSEDGVTRTYALEADYTNEDNDFYFLSQNDFIHPQLVFTKEEETNEASINETYFVEFFDLTTPRYMVQKKLRAYVEYFDSAEPEEWQEQMGQDEPPIILIVCPTLAEMIYAKRYARKQLNDAYDDIPEEIKIWFSTIEKVKTNGLTAVIWEDV